jgi:hypothetical protein
VQKLKQRYKIKKHKLYKNIYTNLKRKIEVTLRLFSKKSIKGTPIEVKIIVDPASIDHKLFTILCLHPTSFTLT